MLGTSLPGRSTSRTTEGLGTQEEGMQEMVVAGLCEAGVLSAELEVTSQK